MRTRLIAALTASLLGGPALDGRQAQSPAPSPVSLTLRLADGRTQFRIGETIPVELEFASHIRNRFTVDGATYDRSGRLAIDRFTVEPNAGATDPLLGIQALGDFIGGLRTIGVLGEKPFIVRLELNEWIRFDEPGQYRVSVRSFRVQDGADAVTSPKVRPVDSTVVTISIVQRDREWEARQLALLKAQFDRPVAPLGRRPACRGIRFLGTSAAVDEMIQLYDVAECSAHFRLGLIGAPDRAYVICRMKAHIDMPHQTVSPHFLNTLSLLSDRPVQCGSASRGRPRLSEQASPSPNFWQRASHLE